MNYVIEELAVNNAEDYARVNVLAWKQSYKGIVNDNFIALINTEEEIQKTIEKLKNGLLRKIASMIRKTEHLKASIKQNYYLRYLHTLKIIKTTDSFGRAFHFQEMVR